ncbi:hypothetical protein [Flavonifractor plautii]|uniref:hypothetical protein n=1 Tax=Flavonifractor TaxID=946234 RepID=UPI0013026AEE|nr:MULTISPECIES: hypothetical protein [Flavonifractor]MBM6664408.1 hypothetical protein [Flavonifractor plautii]HIZ93543.1 hypothetical protein [Candidatus Flavonifractor avicola]
MAKTLAQAEFTSAEQVKSSLGPRTAQAVRDLGAPSFVTDAQLNELNIVCTKKEDEE